MSDMMRKPPMGGGMGGGMGGAPGGDVIKENMSPFNPTDLGMMKQNMSPDMSVRDFMSQMGIDVDGPVSQLEQLAGKQTSNATGLGKMRNIAKAPPMGGAPMGPSGPPAGPSPGMDKLLAGR